MLADYHTKPLQGRLLKIFRKAIMGHESIEWFNRTMSTIKERVGGVSEKDKKFSKEIQKESHKCW